MIFNTKQIYYFGLLISCCFLNIFYMPAAAAACSKSALYAGCPWDGGKLASHDGRFSIEEMGPENTAALLKRYNHSPNGCMHPANKVIAAYSRYEEGQIFYLHKNILEQSEMLDRVLLRDLLDKKTILDIKKIHGIECRHAQDYMPTKQNYTMPDF